MQTIQGAATWKGVRLAEDGEPASAAFVMAAASDNADREAYLLGLLTAVADIAALRALNTSDAVQFPDKHVRFMGMHGAYVLDRASVLAETLPRVIAPTTGPGRWILAGRLPPRILRARLAPFDVFRMGSGGSVNIYDDQNVGGVAQVDVIRTAFGFELASVVTASNSPTRILHDLTPILLPFQGMTLTGGRIYRGSRNAYLGLPQTRSRWGVIRYDAAWAGGDFTLGNSALKSGTGYDVDPSADATAYGQAHWLAYTADQNNVIDCTRYTYCLTLLDEGGTNALPNRVYSHLELTLV